VSRYVEIRPDEEGLPPEILLGVGDIVRFAASGGRLRSGNSVELLGILSVGVVGTDGQVLSPLGPPSSVLIRAQGPGRAVVDITSGDPFRSPVTRSLAIRVEA